NQVRERNVHLLYSEMQTGRKNKMNTMDQSLFDLYQRGEITYDVALSNAREPNYIRSQIEKKRYGRIQYLSIVVLFMVPKLQNNR
ncbi:MAG: hypothetical protein ACKO8U_11705, partial [Pirellula sp.]